MNNFLRLYRYQLLFLVGLLGEISLQSFFRIGLGIYVSPIMWITAACLIGYSAMKLLAFQEVDPYASQVKSPDSKAFSNLLYAGFSIVLAASCGVYLNGVFHEIPVDPKLSDVIPSLEMYVQRLLAGEVVYRPLQFDGYYVDPTYFPLLWSPYILSEVAGMDYRWTAYIVFVIAILLHQYHLVKKGGPTWEIIAKMIIPFLWVYLLAKHDPGSMGMAVELLPVGFYLLLSLSVFHRNMFIMAAGIVLCLLSRYAFTFWLPVYLLTYAYQLGLKNFIKVSALVALGVVLIYIIPVLSKDWESLSRGLAYYKTTAVGQWRTQPWQSDGEIPFQLKQGLSLSIYFYEFRQETVDVLTRLSMNRLVHPIICLFTAIAMFIGFFRYRTKGLNTKLYLLICLKVYLAIFYSFFYVPFNYLYQLPLFMTIPLLYRISFSFGSLTTGKAKL